MARRANNGMGSIRQRSDGRWEARYSAPDGRQRSVYAKSESEVTKKLRAALHDLDAGHWREPSKMRVSEWVDIWIDEYHAHSTEETRRKYRGLADTHYVPVLGALKVSSVTPMHVRKLMNGLHKSGLSPVTVRNDIRILRACFQCAIDAGLIRENPVDGIRLPRAQQASFSVIDRGDIPAFIAASYNTPYPMELQFLLMTGLRVGELRGLRWSDCDLDAGTVSVERQLHIDGGQRFAPPKYGEIRKIHLVGEAVEILKEQRKRQLEQRLKHGWQDDDITRDLVFRLKNGSAHNSRSVYDAVRSVGAEIGMALHPHDLRHSYAVAALRSGADVKTVQHNLGHASAAMTLDTYAAYTDDAGKAGAEMLSNYIKQSSNCIKSR